MNALLQLSWNSAGGFRLPDQWVWCGSAVRSGGKYCLFAACWPSTFPMLEGYLLSSRIVLAVSDTPEGPYRYRYDIAPEPGSGLRMAHNPTVLRRDGRYYLYFIGSTYPGEPDPGNPELLAEIYRNIRIYLMESDSPTGPWRMHEEPILQPQPDAWDAALVTNPAPCLLPDGRIHLYYRSNTPQGLRIGLAEADAPASPYRRKLDHPVLEGFNVEDPFVWHDGKRFRMLAKDMTGEITGELHAGAAFESDDGINWRCLGKGYSRTIRNENGGEFRFGSLERPQLLLNEHGEPEYLFAAVKLHNGVPTFFFDGKPHSGISYMSYAPSETVARNFHEVGINLFSFVATPTDSTRDTANPAWIAPEKFDFSQLDQRAMTFLNAAPDARLIIRLVMSAPVWWCRQHPEETVKIRKEDGTITEFFAYTNRNQPNPAPSWASELWRRDTLAALEKLIRHVETSPYADRVAGYHLGSGPTDEWLLWTDRKQGGRSDFSTPNIRKFRAWLREKYGSDEALRRAWNNAAVTLDTAEIPDTRSRETSRFRQTGGAGTSHFMTPVGSVRLHGKLWIDENDIRTSISYKNAGVAWGQPADLAGDRLQQTKELANVIVNGCGSWWFNVASNRYDHPEIQKLIANLVRCADRSVALDRTPVDRFAVVLDATGPDYLRTGGRTAKEFLLERLPALSRSGAAFGHYITDDLDRLADHKLLLFPFSIAPDPAQVRALEKLKNSNRILVFFNGADSFPHRPGAPKGKNGDFTGIRIAKSKHSIPGDFTFSDVPGFTDGLAGKQFGSAKKRIDPAFLPDAPGMVVLARDSRNNPVVALKRHPGWTAVYCTQIALPARFWANLATAAGVHRYIDTPDVVWANRSQLAVCVDQPGKRTIRLPEPRRVREMFSGQTVSNSPVSSFTREFSRGETALFELIQ